MMYYVGMLQFHLENSYQGKIEDFCDAYPEEIDIFGIARDIVFFLQVTSIQKYCAQKIWTGANSTDSQFNGCSGIWCLESFCWKYPRFLILNLIIYNKFIVLENYEVPKDWASIGYTTANYYLNGIDGSLEELEIISNTGFLFAGRSLASFATETVQDFICYWMLFWGSDDLFNKSNAILFKRLSFYFILLYLFPGKRQIFIAQ